MMVDLGGPGTACSAMRVRRLRAGELQGAERERTQQHVDGCGRCQAALRELDEERVRLAREVPFDAFAAGVAEKLARVDRPPRWSRWVPLAAAAALLLAVGTTLSLQKTEEVGVRTKGGAAVELFEKAGGEVRAVRGRVGEGPIMVHLRPSGHAYAAVVLVEPGESTLLYSGPARTELPEAFEWTGAARKATLRAVFAGQPIDGEALRRQGVRGAPKGAAVVEVPLERAP